MSLKDVQCKSSKFCIQSTVTVGCDTMAEHDGFERIKPKLFSSNIKHEDPKPESSVCATSKMKSNIAVKFETDNKKLNQGDEIDKKNVIATEDLNQEIVEDVHTAFGSGDREVDAPLENMLDLNEFDNLKECLHLSSSKNSEDSHSSKDFLGEKKWTSNLSRSEGSGSSFFSCGSDHVDGIAGIGQRLSSLMQRQRSESETSLEYYRAGTLQLQMANEDELQHVVKAPEPNRHNTQSRRLPFWMWYIIAKSLGIKLHDNDRPIPATILYTLTFASAIGFCMSNCWFAAYDIASDYTKTTVIDGTVGVLITVLWGALGLYANKLAYRLFSHQKFVNMLRLHSKTILKMNAAVILFVIMLAFVVINNITAFTFWKDESCETVSVEIIVCKIHFMTRVVYSVFAFIWNYLVAFVVISVCRTHTIGIRKFMQRLEMDSRVYEARYCGRSQRHMEMEVLEEYTWVDEDYLEELQEGSTSEGDNSERRRESDLPSTSDIGAHDYTHTSDSRLPVHSEARPQAERSKRNSSCSSGLSSAGQLSGVNSAQGVDVIDMARDEASTLSYKSQGKASPSLSNAEILFQYWKIQTRLRLSSVALQRWMMSVLSFVIIWIAINLVMWMNHNPSLVDLSNFILPILLLPLLSSAYAEVNQEGLRLLKFIVPVEERLQMLYVLQNMPLQMTVYGFSLSYSTISTAAFGVLLAFASKILLQEIAGVS
ncbi:uncharacterized protein LOC143026518 isoform X2 [Oratosquilla oratoria]|uniref:uncharacterized protein LOC143026518 isoform X2 n=1 Tax=Oratosquilla oratoria TaxID=337810 RepID=UPI003F76F045